MQLDDIETPALLLDAPKMERNIARMRARMASLGVSFRPHLKTNKSIDVSRRLFDGTGENGIGPVTASTLKEADCFVGHGFTDILYAVGIMQNKLKHVADLRARVCDPKVILGNHDAVQIVAAFTAQSGQPTPTLIEVDGDGQRAGVPPEADELITIGSALTKAGALAGVMTHAGDSYNCTSVDAIRAIAEQERALTVRAAERVRAANLARPSVSVGSTPTATYAEKGDGVSAVRAGVFVFFDLVMAGIKVCKVDYVARSVLATVIGHQRDRGGLITDAGWAAMVRPAWVRMPAPAATASEQDGASFWHRFSPRRE